MDGWMELLFILKSVLCKQILTLFQPLPFLVSDLWAVKGNGYAESTVPSHWMSRKADLKQLCFWHLYAEYLARESGTLSLLKKFKVAPLAKESKTDDLGQHAEISASIPCLWISFLLGLHSSYDLACRDKTWAPLCQAAIIAVLHTGHPFSISLPLILSWMRSDTALVII